MEDGEMRVGDLILGSSLGGGNFLFLQYILLALPYIRIPQIGEKPVSFTDNP